MQIRPFTPALAGLLFALPTTPTTPQQPVEWVHSFADAKAQAASSRKLMLVYCWADGSDYCTKLYQDTLSDPSSASGMSQFVCYSARHGGAGVEDLFSQYGVKTLPTMLFVDSSGKADDLIQGFIPADEFQVELKRIQSGKGTVTELEARMVAAEPGSEEDIDARWQLAGKIQALGQNGRHDELMASIRKVDPKGKTLVGARMLLQDLTKAAVGKAGSGAYGDRKNDRWDLTSLYAHAKTTGHQTAKHEAWQQIGNLEAKRANMQAAFKAYRAAWKSCPKEKVVEWSNDLARWIIKSAEQRTSKEKKFALELARKALATMKKSRKEDPPGRKHQTSNAKHEADCWNTVAWGLHINGQQEAAVKAARKAISLDNSDKYLADLERIQR